MNWWTAEYGLIGSEENPKIYGAGLLSSVAESRSSLLPGTKKIEFSLQCIEFSYDITEPQPQLFVVKDFENLTQTLEEMAESMAFRKGGSYGLEVAQISKTVNTVQYDTGIQVSGMVKKFLTKNEKPIYFMMEGPTQICIGNCELPNQGKERHVHGFGGPVFSIEGKTAKEIDWQKIGLQKNSEMNLRFDSGIQVQGKVKDIILNGEVPGIITFTDCKVTYGDEILFDPSWGEYDMTVGSSIESVFGGPADRQSYGMMDDFTPLTVPEKKRTSEVSEHEDLYSKIRNIRENKSEETFLLKEVKDVLETLRSKFEKDWLLKLEILEILKERNFEKPLQDELETELQEFAKENSHFCEPILDGIKISHLSI